MRLKNLMRALLFCMTLISMCQALEVGKLAPALEAKTLDGQTFNATKPVGDVVIIHFWATWCTPCRHEMPILDAYYQQHKTQGLRMLAISMDDPADQQTVREVMQTFHFPTAIERDADYRGYGKIWRMPMTFVIDRNGNLQRDGSVGDPKIDLSILDTVVTPLLEVNATPQ